MTYTDRITAMLRAAATSADHHFYYRSLNRLAGFLAAAGSVTAAGQPVEMRAETFLLDLERELGPDFLGYGGRPLFPALRRRVAETLIELGY